MRATVIGLGSMGWGAAVSLLRAGIETTGVDVAETVVEAFRAEGGTATTDLGEGVRTADVVFVFVVNAQQVRGVLFGSKGAVQAAPLGCVFVICSTISPADAVAIAGDLAAAGMRVLDAPVSGGVAKAREGAMTLIASGAPDAFEAAGPALDAISEKVFRLGDTPGMGSKLKMINQLLAGVHIAAMGEAMSLAAAEGLDLRVVHEVVSQSAGSSWMWQRRGPQIVEGDYAPHSAVDIFVKDLGIVHAAATEDGLSLPLVEAALAVFRETSEAGLGREGDVAVAKTISARAGIRLPGVTDGPDEG